MTAEQERARVVKYLQETAEIFDSYAQKGEMPIKAKHHAESCRLAASAIQRMEHWHGLEAKA